MRKIFKTTVLAVISLIAMGQANACQECHYEKCAWGLCACIPNSSCVIFPPVPVILKPLVPEYLGPRLVVSTLEQATKDIAETIKKAFDDTNRTALKAWVDIGKNTDKAIDDSKAEIGRFGRELGSVGQAVIKYTQNEVQGNINSLQQNVERVRQGKFIDAIWHQALGPVQVEEKSASIAVLESSYLRGVGQVAATAYGGPGGAAAYAAWVTYRQTGDPSLALRVGILTGATAWANGAASKITDDVQREIVTAAIGGATVAAAGGNAEAVKQAFLLAGAAVVIQDGYRENIGGELDGRSSKGEAYCISATSTNCTPLPPGAKMGIDEKGNYIVDMRKVDQSVPAVGLKDHTALFQETNPIMTGVSRIPGMQAMAVFHDTWAIDWHMGELATPATILPAIAITYVGLGAPFYEKLQATAVESALKIDGSPDIGKQTGEKVVRFAASDSFIKFKRGEVTKVVVKEQQFERFCSGEHEIYRDQKVSTGKFSGDLTLVVSTCLYRTNAGEFKSRTPKAQDYACRVVVMNNGVGQLLWSSLFDPNGCDAVTEKHVKDDQGADVVWYRGDARQIALQANSIPR